MRTVLNMAESEENQETSPDITDDITIVELARESVKDKNKESAVWLFFEKTDDKKSGSQDQR